MHYDVCEKVASLCDVSVIWLTDDPYEASRNLEASRLFDLVYTNDRASVSRYGNKGRHLPFAGSKEYHYYEVLGEASSQLRYDVFFLGAAWPNRVRLLDSLLKDLKGKRFKIGLSPTGAPASPIRFSLPESSYLWRTSAPEFARLANRSRITLALHRDFTTNRSGHSLASTPPPRLFEAAMAGTLQLYDAALTETADYFEPGRELVPYVSPADCAAKISYYLSHPFERDRIARAAQKKAIERHLYESRVRVIVADLAAFPLKKKQPVSSRSHRPRLLFVTHNIAPAGHFGGVEIYQERLANKLASEYEVFFYFRDRRTAPNTFVLSDAKYNVLEEIRFDNECLGSALSVPIKEAAFATLLGSYNIDLVHFHHLMNHPVSLVLIARMLNIPTVLTLQDFWTMCDSHNLVDYRRRYCDIANEPDAACDICTDSRLRKPPGIQAMRRSLLSRILLNSDAVIGNTPGFLGILARFYPNTALSDRAYAIPLPLPDVPEHRAFVKAILPAGHRTPLRVAIPGNFTFEKGADAIIGAMRHLRNEPIEFLILGRVDSPYNTILEELKLPNLEIHGQYHHSDLPRLLHGSDLSLHMSMWPETYCIALSEAWHNGLVPIVTRIGALDERVVDGVNGWKIPPDHPAALLDLLRRLVANREMVDQVRAEIASSRGRLYDDEMEHMAKLTSVYRNLSAKAPMPRKTPSRERVRSRLTLFEAGIVFTPHTWSRIFEAHREATTIREWTVSSGNPYVSVGDRSNFSGAQVPQASAANARHAGSDVQFDQRDGLRLKRAIWRGNQPERSMDQNRSGALAANKILDQFGINGLRDLPDLGQVVFANPASRFALPGEAVKLVRFEFGIYDLALQASPPPDGVVFSVIVKHNNGKERVLWTRTLTPVTQPLDRGVHKAEVSLSTNDKDRLVFEALAVKDPVSNWAFWRNVYLVK
jgi:glycosyltransferase involved in cell wall biosynthesis